MRRKKWYRLAGIIGILLCMMVTGYVMMCAAVTASAEQVQGEFVYELSEDGKTAVLLQYKGKGGQVKVPDKLGGKPVANIGTNAFRGCKELTELALPEGLTEIGEYAFWYCSGLSAVQWPSTLKKIDGYAFFGCTALTEVKLPDHIQNIGNWAFSGCSNLSAVSLPDSVRIVGSGAWDNTAWYNRQPDGNVVIGHCYYKYKGVMPDNYTVTVGENITVVADGAFSDCETLVSVTLPDGLTRLGNSLFFHCKRLFAVTIPDKVTEIGENTFAGCNQLKSVTLPDSAVSVGKNAFADCLTMATVVLPHSLQRIGEDAFVGCPQLYEVIYIGTREEFDRIQMEEGTRKRLEGNLIFAVSSEDITEDSVTHLPTVPEAKRRPVQQQVSNETSGRSETSGRRTAAVIREENKVWEIVIIAGLAFIGVMLLAFIIRAIVSRKKPKTISADTVSQEVQLPRWRNAPSAPSEEDSSTTKK